MAAVVLAGLIGEGHRPVAMPTLVRRYDHDASGEDAAAAAGAGAITPNRILRPHGHAFVRSVLQAPLCHRLQGTPAGTLKSLSSWCATERPGLRLHIAKTGTDTKEDPNQTVDTWIAGGLQFASGNAYSYVVLVGTGSTREPFGRSLHAAQVAAPLLNLLLADLESAQGRRQAAAAPAEARTRAIRVP
jgi:hypothetical protein